MTPATPPRPVLRRIATLRMEGSGIERISRELGVSRRRLPAWLEKMGFDAAVHPKNKRAKEADASAPLYHAIADLVDVGGDKREVGVDDSAPSNGARNGRAAPRNGSSNTDVERMDLEEVKLELE